MSDDEETNGLLEVNLRKAAPKSGFFCQNFYVKFLLVLGLMLGLQIVLVLFHYSQYARDITQLSPPVMEIVYINNSTQTPSLKACSPFLEKDHNHISNTTKTTKATYPQLFRNRRMYPWRFDITKTYTFPEEAIRHENLGNRSYFLKNTIRTTNFRREPLKLMGVSLYLRVWINRDESRRYTKSFLNAACVGTLRQAIEFLPIEQRRLINLHIIYTRLGKEWEDFHQDVFQLTGVNIFHYRLTKELEGKDKIGIMMHTQMMQYDIAAKEDINRIHFFLEDDYVFDRSFIYETIHLHQTYPFIAFSSPYEHGADEYFLPRVPQEAPVRVLRGYSSYWRTVGLVSLTFTVTGATMRHPFWSQRMREHLMDDVSFFWNNWLLGGYLVSPIPALVNHMTTYHGNGQKWLHWDDFTAHPIWSFYVDWDSLAEYGFHDIKVKNAASFKACLLPWELQTPFDGHKFDS